MNLDKDIIKLVLDENLDIIYRILINENRIEYSYSSHDAVLGLKTLNENTLSNFKNRIEILSKNTFDNAIAEVLKNIPKNNPIRFEYKISNQKKIQLTFLDKFFKISDNEILVYSKNISELKKNEIRFNKEEQRLKAILNNTIQFYFFLDIQYKILYMNEKAKEFFSKSLEQNIFEGYSLKDYLPIEDVEKFTSCFEHTFQGNTIKYETSILYPDKSKGWYEFTFLPVKDKANINSICLSIHDITERKNSIDSQNNLNIQLIEFNKDLEKRVDERTEKLQDEIKIRKVTEEKLVSSLEKEKELNELKTRFISIVSHEFRTPMTVISASAQLLETYGEKFTLENKKKHFSKITESIMKLTNLMESVLKASRAETQMLNLNKEEFKLISFCDSLLSNFETMNPKFIFKKNYTIDSEFALYTDKILLSHILENLLSNAIKYSKDLYQVDFIVSRKNHFIEFIVKDYGIGIPDADQEKISKGFFRASNVSKIEGTGIGLSLVRNFINTLDGEFYFESTHGVGSSFYIKVRI